MPSSPLGSTRSNDVACHHRRWTSSHSKTASGVACHHRTWTTNKVEQRRAWHAIIAVGLAHTVRRRQAWHAIIALGRQTRSNDFGRGTPSSPLGSTDGRKTSGVAFHHRLWTGSYSRTASGVECFHRPWRANTVECHEAGHAIIASRQQTR